MIAGVVTGSPEWYAAREEILRAAWEGFEIEDIQGLIYEGFEFGLEDVDTGDV